MAASPQIKKGGRGFAAGCVEGLWKKVLKIDRPFRAGGFLSLTALQAEGCGIALSGDEYEVSVTELAFCVIWHDTHSGDWLTAFTTKGGNCGMVHEIYDSLFFLSILLVSP